MSGLSERIALSDTFIRTGRVIEASGTVIKVSGICVSIGDLCELRDRQSGYSLRAEVVGLSDLYTLLTPLGSLNGVCATMEVVPLKQASNVAVGAGLLGRVIDGQGLPIDDSGPLNCTEWVPLIRPAPSPLKRLPVKDVFSTGIRAIDGLLTTGLGQRIGIFASAGGGKSTLLGMLARGADSDVNIIVLVGERGREVREFIEENLDESSRTTTVTIVATSDRPAMERCRAALLGTAIAEYFRDQGKRVLLMMDSVTRYARALREIGLALGEPPARRGFPPSVFANLPLLVERAGNNEHGYITAFYTVLLEDEQDGEDPIGEEVRSLLDGHLILSKKLAARAHYPAIDVLVSASRIMPRLVSSDHNKAAQRVRSLMAKYNDVEMLLQIGEFQRGSDSLADEAIDKHQSIREFLCQSSSQLEAHDSCKEKLLALIGQNDQEARTT